MPAHSDFVQHVLEILAAGFGPVQVRRMFGGWGLYHQSAFFALVLDDALYLKADAESAAAFDDAGLAHFVYEKKRGGPIETKYRAAPEDALESPEVMAQWARLAYAAALRAAVARRRIKPAQPARPDAKARASKSRARRR